MRIQQLRDRPPPGAGQSRLALAWFVPRYTGTCLIDHFNHYAPSRPGRWHRVWRRGSSAADRLQAPGSGSSTAAARNERTTALAAVALRCLDEGARLAAPAGLMQDHLAAARRSIGSTLYTTRDSSTGLVASDQILAVLLRQTPPRRPGVHWHSNAVWVRFRPALHGRRRAQVNQLVLGRSRWYGRDGHGCWWFIPAQRQPLPAKRQAGAGSSTGDLPRRRQSNLSFNVMLLRF